MTGTKQIAARNMPRAASALNAGVRNALARVVPLLLLFSTALGTGCRTAARFPDDWNYDGSFHRRIARADRIVIRDGGFDCCRSVKGQKALLEITDPEAIGDFNRHLAFKAHQPWTVCMCCGYPGIDWYRGGKRIALTSVQHGRAIRWDGFPGDAALTEPSSAWLVDWFLMHGIAGQYDEFKKAKEKAMAGPPAADIRAPQGGGAPGP